MKTVLKYIKKMVSKMLYGPKSDSESYIKYLRKNGCDIGEGCYFYSPRTTVVDIRTDWITIGKYTKITSGVVILAHDYSPSVLVHTHNEILLEGGKHTSIGDNCFIGVNAIILPGRHIGDNCIIGTGAVVTTDIPDNMVAVGNPAKIIMSVDEFYQKRKNSYLNDAKRNVSHFFIKHRRYPNTYELKGFSLLYLERSMSNFRKYFATYLTRDNSELDIEKCFFSTEPLFESYEKFIEFCIND